MGNRGREDRKRPRDSEVVGSTVKVGLHQQGGEGLLGGLTARSKSYLTSKRPLESALGGKKEIKKKGGGENIKKRKLLN